jgi:hypothetical protein
MGEAVEVVQARLTDGTQGWYQIHHGPGLEAKRAAGLAKPYHAVTGNRLPAMTRPVPATPTVHAGGGTVGRASVADVRGRLAKLADRYWADNPIKGRGRDAFEGAGVYDDWRISLAAGHFALCDRGPARSTVAPVRIMRADLPRMTAGPLPEAFWEAVKRVAICAGENRRVTLTLLEDDRIEVSAGDPTDHGPIGWRAREVVDVQLTDAAVCKPVHYDARYLLALAGAEWTWYQRDADTAGAWESPAGDLRVVIMPMRM